MNSLGFLGSQRLDLLPFGLLRAQLHEEPREVEHARPVRFRQGLRLREELRHRNRILLQRASNLSGTIQCIFATQNAFSK